MDTPLSPEEQKEKQKKVERIKTLIAKSKYVQTLLNYYLTQISHSTAVYLAKVWLNVHPSTDYLIHI